jgi:hypothetical protein
VHKSNLFSGYDAPLGEVIDMRSPYGNSQNDSPCGHQNSEHWSKREPFVSTNRIFGRIECVTATASPKGTILTARGWIFDKSGRLSQLDMMSPGDSEATTVYGIERLDVLSQFREFAQARLSGFVARLPLQQSDSNPRRIQIQGSCVCSDTQVHFLFEEHSVSYGIRKPGDPIIDPPEAKMAHGTILALVIPTNNQLPSSLATPLIEYASRHNLTVAIFYNRPSSELDSISQAPLWQNRISYELDTVAGNLWGLHQHIHSIAVLGDLNRELTIKQLIPLTAVPPLPHIFWITENKPQVEIPLEMRGCGIKIIEAKGDWIQRIRYHAMKPTAASRAPALEAS